VGNANILTPDVAAASQEYCSRAVNPFGADPLTSTVKPGAFLHIVADEAAWPIPLGWKQRANYPG
jgi:hypothetical protein